MSAHTPGPWSFVNHNERAPEIQYVLDAGREEVAVIYNPESDANARLIAAAPDLLAALERTVDLAERWAEGSGRSSPDHESIAEARAAIAKARGER